MVMMDIYDDFMNTFTLDAIFVSSVMPARSCHLPQWPTRSSYMCSGSNDSVLLFSKVGRSKLKLRASTDIGYLPTGI